MTTAAAGGASSSSFSSSSSSSSSSPLASAVTVPEALSPEVAVGRWGVVPSAADASAMDVPEMDCSDRGVVGFSFDDVLAGRDWEDSTSGSTAGEGCCGHDTELNFLSPAADLSRWVDVVMEDFDTAGMLGIETTTTAPTAPTITSTPSAAAAAAAAAAASALSTFNTGAISTLSVSRSPVWLEMPLPSVEGFSLSDGYREVESIVTDFGCGVFPSLPPQYMQKLALAEGGLVHSTAACFLLTGLSMRTTLRFFAIDMLSSGLSTALGRQVARKALSGTRFANVMDSELRLAYQRLLAPETVLSPGEVKMMLCNCSPSEIETVTPRVFQSVETTVLLIGLGRELVQLRPMPKHYAAYDGELCPAHLLDPVKPDSFLKHDFVDDSVSAFIIQASRLKDPKIAHQKPVIEAARQITFDIIDSFHHAASPSPAAA